MYSTEMTHTSSFVVSGVIVPNGQGAYSLEVEALDARAALHEALATWEADGRLSLPANRGSIFAVEPSAVWQAARDRGWQVVHNGGGCLAYQKRDARGEWLITADDGASLPESMDEQAMLGLYDEDGQQVGECTFATTCELLSETSS
jgi:hypothetical protein